MKPGPPTHRRMEAGTQVPAQSSISVPTSCGPRDGLLPTRPACPSSRLSVMTKSLPEIRHALRFTAPHTRKEFIWPARHYASFSTCLNYPPMGQRSRLKADFDISGFSLEVQVILQAEKIWDDSGHNGSSWFIGGAGSSLGCGCWSGTAAVKGSSFEAVDELPHDRPDSGQARQDLQQTPSLPPSRPASPPWSSLRPGGPLLDGRNGQRGGRGLPDLPHGLKIAATDGTSYQDLGLAPNTRYPYPSPPMTAPGMNQLNPLGLPGPPAVAEHSIHAG